MFQKIEKIIESLTNDVNLFLTYPHLATWRKSFECYVANLRWRILLRIGRLFPMGWEWKDRSSEPYTSGTPNTSPEGKSDDRWTRVFSDEDDKEFDDSFDNIMSGNFFGWYCPSKNDEDRNNAHNEDNERKTIHYYQNQNI